DHHPDADGAAAAGRGEGQRVRRRRGRAADAGAAADRVRAAAAVRRRRAHRAGERGAVRPAVRRPRRVRRRQVDEALSAMGLTDAAQRLVETYSGGMIRRPGLAQALANAPRLLVLDEPTVGLDPIARADVWEFIAGLRQSSHTTVLMTTHYMEEADLHCDRVALMHHGTLRATGTSAELKAGLG